MKRLSVVIKCFNEAQKIDEAIRSALAARSELGAMDLEVVVADGLSTDETTTRALQWAQANPVRVVQLLHEEDRTCGAGVELGFVSSTGDVVFFMDGDMVLQSGFLKQAMRYLDQHPRCAGVAGVVTEALVFNATDRIRMRQGLNRSLGAQPWLNGGGLYRREALLSAEGVAGDRRLAAFEEADLGLRLERAGWTLHRLREVSVLHRGHALPAWKVLGSRWRAGRFEAAGRLLKLHGAKKNGWRVWRLLAHPILLTAAWSMLLALALNARASASLKPVLWMSASFCALAIAHLLIKRDVRHVLTAWMDWHLMMLGMLWGVVHPMPERGAGVSHRVLADGVRDPAAGESRNRPFAQVRQPT